MRWLAALALLAGCDAAFGIDELPAANELCIGRHGPDASGMFSTCLAAPPPMTLPAFTTIDTDADCTEVVAQEGTELCLVAAYDIAIRTKLATRGTRPLVLVALHTFSIADTGGVSVASHRDRETGAGAGYAACATNLAGTSTTVPSSGGAGGAGGSFQTIGGQGGAADGNPTHALPRLDPEPAFVRGGCNGGAGGRSPTSLGGTAGASGGALYTIAGRELVIAGVLDASGASGGGGIGGTSTGGGGGGGAGSGGLIGLDAPSLRIEATAKLLANGGGGGGAGSSSQAGLGGTESDPTSPFPFTSAGGAGGSSNSGGPGGAGATIDTAAQNGANTAGSGGGGGGGGGGGAGFIKVFSAHSDIVGSPGITPAPT